MQYTLKLRATKAAALVGVATLAAAAPLVGLGGGTAFAGTGGGASPPAWDNTGSPPADPNSQPPYGSLVFYDTDGKVVTSGTNLNHLFDFAAATTAKDTGATKATLYLAAPNHSLPTTSWAYSIQSASNTFPNSSAPYPLTGTGGTSPTGFQNPLDTLTATDANLAAALGGFTLDTTAGYANIIQVRVKDSGAGGVGSGSNYWSTDIAYNNGTSAIIVDGVSVAPGSWQQLYPNYTTTSVTLMASPASPQNLTGCATHGQDVTLTATVSPTTVTGTVQFMDGSTKLGSAAPVNGSGQATGTLPAPATGTHNISAIFIPTPGTQVQGSSSTPQGYAVNPPSSGPTTTTTLMANPNTNVPFSSPVMLSAGVTASDSLPAGVAGSVQFFNGTTSLGTSNTTVSGTSGTATLSTSQLPVGTDSLTAQFTPTNSCYSGSTSTPATSVTVVAANTTTSVASSLPGGSVTGQTVTFTATVASTGGATATPTGSVQFKDNGTIISSCNPVPLNSGMAACPEQPATAGTHTITALYTPGNGNFNPSDNTASPRTQTVTAATTTTSLISSANPANAPATVNYTATVIANPPGSLTPAGTVDFKDNGTNITGCVGLTLVSGSVACMNQMYSSAGTHPITAVYNNTDGNYTTSTSAVLNQQITTATTTAVQPPSGSIVDGAQATFTATVNPAPNGGTVDFFDGTTKICSGASVDSSTGHSTCAARLFGAGSHSITATYSGFGLFGPSNSNAAPVTQTVTADTVTVALTTSAPNGAVTGQKVNYTATVTPNPPGSGTPAGFVEFQDNGTDISGCAQVALSGGQAVCDPVYGAPGSHSISAIYHDLDGNYVGAASASPVVQTVKLALGYWMVGSDGGVFTFGGTGFFGSLAGLHLNGPIVGMALTHDRLGYWLVGRDGGVFTFGDAVFYGSTGAVHLNAPVVGIAATPSGHGYWLVAADGGVFTFGDAVFYGSTGANHLNAPVVGIAATPSGLGYWLVAKDGGVFTFGDAVFYGSLGATHLNAPVVGIVATPTGHGYWLVAKDGGVFTFGDAVFYGSTGAVHLNAPIVGMAVTQSGAGYRLFANDGGVFDFGDATYQGSLPGGGISVHNIVGGS